MRHLVHWSAGLLRAILRGNPSELQVRASKQVLSNMYRGMLGKFAIMIVGFILILSNVKPLSPLALLFGFILVQAMSWVAPFWVSRLQNGYRNKKN